MYIPYTPPAPITPERLERAVRQGLLQYGVQPLLLANVVTLCADTIEGWSRQVPLDELAQLQCRLVPQMSPDSAREFLRAEITELLMRRYLTLSKDGSVALTEAGINLVEPLIEDSFRFLCQPRKIEHHRLMEALDNARPFEPLALTLLLDSCTDAKSWGPRRLKSLVRDRDDAGELGIGYAGLKARDLVRFSYDDEGCRVHPTPKLANFLFVELGAFRG